MPNEKAVTNRVRICAALAEARDVLIADNRGLRRKQSHLAREIRSAEARVERLNRRIDRLRERRDAFKKGKSR